MVRGGLKLPGDGGEIPTSQRENVGGSNPSCKISSLLDGKLAKWLFTSYALALAYRSHVSKKNYEKLKNQ